MQKLLIVAAVAGLAFTTVGATAASAAAAANTPEAYLTNANGDDLAEVALEGGNRILICDRSTDHRYAMAKVHYNGHWYQYMNFYKNQDCVEQKTRDMSAGKIEFWACVSKPYKLRFDYCGDKQTVYP